MSILIFILDLDFCGVLAGEVLGFNAVEERGRLGA